MTIVLAGGIRYMDLQFLGVPQVIATAVLDGVNGVALVDPGPASALGTLKRGLDGLGVKAADVSEILLTHIHLDHAGATGSLLRECPRATVFVHERGARHMVDPSRLIDSATRLYGDAMHRLWGEFLPVPADRVRALSGGERIEAAGRSLDVAYTPGHASHHVAYLDARSRTAFVGDVAGIRIGGSDFIMPPTPPPDIDLDAWQESARKILAWHPETLFLTHFGPSGAPAHHLETLIERLGRHAALVGDVLTRGGSPEEQVEAFRKEVGSELRHQVTESEAASYELAVPLDHCFAGLARYWRKRHS
jgi:glyoxylase-like metal-dependent hydrolase (beta-lactamase superfamily II)